MYRNLYILNTLMRKSCVRSYAKASNVAKKAVPTATLQKSKHLEVEEDAEKLCKYVCGANIYIDGEDPEIKPDSEYPDWLWTLRIERGAPRLEDLDPDTYKYWRHVRKQELIRKSKLRKVMFRYKDFG